MENLPVNLETVRMVKTHVGWLLQNLPEVGIASYAECAIALGQLKQEFEAIDQSRSASISSCSD